MEAIPVTRSKKCGLFECHKYKQAREEQMRGTGDYLDGKEIMRKRIIYVYTCEKCGHEEWENG